MAKTHPFLSQSLKEVSGLLGLSLLSVLLNDRMKESLCPNFQLVAYSLVTSGLVPVTILLLVGWSQAQLIN